MRLTHNMAMIQPSFTSSKQNMGKVLQTLQVTECDYKNSM